MNRVYVAVVGMFWSVAAFAQAAPGTGPLRDLADLLSGTYAQLIALVAVIIIGIAAMFNKLSLRWALSLAAGIIIVVGASWIVTFFGL